jgi:hypothetical protein
VDLSIVSQTFFDQYPVRTMFFAKNTKPKNRFSGYPKTGFSVLKNLRVTRFFGFGKNRVGNLVNECI